MHTKLDISFFLIIYILQVTLRHSSDLKKKMKNGHHQNKQNSHLIYKIFLLVLDVFLYTRFSGWIKICLLWV